MPILIICNIWGKINLPEVARKNITAPTIKMKINFLYISGYLEILFLLLRKIINIIITIATTINNLTIRPMYIEI